MGDARREQRERRAYRITGRVQGVGFRWWTHQTASKLAVAGTVRNAADGSVEIDASGPPARLDELEHRLRQGPPQAHVQSVERTEPGREPLPAGFEIVH